MSQIRLPADEVGASTTEGDVLTTVGGEAAWAPPSAAGVQSVVAGTNVSVDSTDPANPIVSATGGGGGASGVAATICRRVANQTNTGNLNVWVPIQWDTEDTDTLGLHSTTTNTDRFTVPAGSASREYLVIADAKINSSAGGTSISVRKNGTFISTQVLLVQSAFGGGQVSCLVSCAGGDYIDVSFTSGAVVTVQAGTRVTVKQLL